MSANNVRDDRSSSEVSIRSVVDRNEVRSCCASMDRVKREGGRTLIIPSESERPSEEKQGQSPGERGV